MRKYILYLLTFLSLTFVSCAARWNDPADVSSAEDPWEGAAPRLIVRGTVTSQLGDSLQGIRIDLYGVQDHDEEEIASYNYALTDSLGQYIITRYRGREIPDSITLSASDPEQRYAPVTVRCAGADYAVTYSSGTIAWTINLRLNPLSSAVGRRSAEE